MHDVYGIPVPVLIGVGAGLITGGAIYALFPRPEHREKVAGLVGTGVGLLAAGVAAFLVGRV